jgi:hypothetical protein
MLGFGEKSPFPVAFRVFVRLLRLFILLATGQGATDALLKVNRPWAQSIHQTQLDCPWAQCASFIHQTQLAAQEARAAAQGHKLDDLLLWLEKRQPLQSAAEFVKLAASVLAPHSLALKGGVL